MLNFMVAILSTTYSAMLESGSFKYKCALFEYCERFMIAFDKKNKNCGEIVIHSPPINALCLIMTPFLPFTEIMEKVGEYFSYMNFWIENLFFLTGFVLFELVLSPFVYVLTFFNILYSTNGPFTTVFNVLQWLTFGPIYLFSLLVRDFWFLIVILSYHGGCREKNKK